MYLFTSILIVGMALAASDSYRHRPLRRTPGPDGVQATPVPTIPMSLSPPYDPLFSDRPVVSGISLTGNSPPTKEHFMAAMADWLKREASVSDCRRGAAECTPKMAPASLASPKPAFLQRLPMGLPGNEQMGDQTTLRNWKWVVSRGLTQWKRYVFPMVVDGKSTSFRYHQHCILSGIAMFNRLDDSAQPLQPYADDETPPSTRTRKELLEALGMNQEAKASRLDDGTFDYSLGMLPSPGSPFRLRLAFLFKDPRIDPESHKARKLVYMETQGTTTDWQRMKIQTKIYQGFTEQGLLPHSSPTQSMPLEPNFYLESKTLSNVPDAYAKIFAQANEWFAQGFESGVPNLAEHELKFEEIYDRYSEIWLTRDPIDENFVYQFRPATRELRMMSYHIDQDRVSVSFSGWPQYFASKEMYQKFLDKVYLDLASIYYYGMDLQHIGDVVRDYEDRVTPDPRSLLYKPDTETRIRDEMSVITRRLSWLAQAIRYRSQDSPQ